MKRTILLVAVFAFGLLAAVALAGGGKGRVVRTRTARRHITGSITNATRRRRHT